MKELLEGLELFRDLTEEEWGIFLPACRSRTFSRGDLIYAERTHPPSLFVVESGVVELSRPGHGNGSGERLALLERGGVFGELALAGLPPQDVQATAAVTPETRVVCLEAKEAQTLFEAEPAIGVKIQRNLLRRTAARLCAVTASLRAVLPALEG